jgi:ATP-binding cassette subfamily B protein
MIYIRLFTQPLSQIAQSFTSLQATAAASFRFFEFLEESEMPDESEKHAALENVRAISNSVTYASATTRIR